MNLKFSNQTKQDQRILSNWYLQNARKLPWRANLDPYKIWISEVMLQQTTVTAVVPYFERFIQRFSNVQSLSKSTQEEIYEYWAGLGYYTRAKNILASAKIIAKHGFPQTSQELIKLPGFGPYISNAVASIAFNERVGVLDGNVNRILCRKYGIDSDWWKSKEKSQIQELAHQMTEFSEPRVINQAMMELGATICTPKNPLCRQCPWVKTCVAFANNKVDQLPRKKPAKNFNLWIWKVDMEFKNGKVKIVENHYMPFLKSKPVFPGKLMQVKKVPKKYDILHTITTNKIFIKIDSVKSSSQSTISKIQSKSLKKPKFQEKTQTNPVANENWIKIADVPRVNPSSMLLKIIELQQKNL